MKSKNKKQIKSCFEELKILVGEEAQATVRRLERLFGEVRREFAEQKNCTESQLRLLRSCSEKAENAVRECNLAMRERDALQATIDSNCKKLQRLKSDQEKSHDALNALEYLLTRSWLEDWEVDYVFSRSVGTWFEENEQHKWLAYLLTIPANIQALKSDEFVCHNIPAFDLEICAKRTASNEIMIAIVKAGDVNDDFTVEEFKTYISSSEGFPEQTSHSR